LWINSL